MLLVKTAIVKFGCFRFGFGCFWHSFFCLAITKYLIFLYIVKPCESGFLCFKHIIKLKMIRFYRKKAEISKRFGDKGKRESFATIGNISSFSWGFWAVAVLLCFEI